MYIKQRDAGNMFLQTHRGTGAQPGSVTCMENILHTIISPVAIMMHIYLPIIVSKFHFPTKETDIPQRSGSRCLAGSLGKSLTVGVVYEVDVVSQFLQSLVNLAFVLPCLAFPSLAPFPFHSFCPSLGPSLCFLAIHSYVHGFLFCA